MILKFIFIISCCLFGAELAAQNVFQYQARQEAVTDLKRHYLKFQTASKVLPVLAEMLPEHACEASHNEYVLLCQTSPEKERGLKKIIRWLDNKNAVFLIDVAVYEVVYHKELKKDLGFTNISQGIRYRIDNNQKASPLPEGKLEWMQQLGKATLLANPSLAVNAGEQASIQVGDRVPYVQGEGLGQNVIQQVNFVDTGILLKVKAWPVGRKNIQIQLSADISSIKFWKSAKNQNLPVISSRKAQTVLTVPFDQDIVLAGLIDQQASETQQKIPFLGDIPLLGTLFRKSQREVLQSDILFLLTPKILK